MLGGQDFFKKEQVIMTCVGVFVTLFHSIDYTKALTIPFKNKTTKSIEKLIYFRCFIVGCFFFVGGLMRVFNNG